MLGVQIIRLIQRPASFGVLVRDRLEDSGA